MEVETRISVQAMRGKFEQLPDDNLFPCVPSSTPRLNATSPGRPRTSSLIFKEKDANGNHARCDNVTNSCFSDRQNLNKNTKHSPNSVSRTKNVISDVVSPMLSNSLVVKALSPKKHSVDSSVNKKGNSETRQHDRNDNPVEATPSRKVSQSYVAGTKPSVVKRIPVFKSFNGGFSSDEKTPGKSDSKDSSVEIVGKRERFLGHIRSRSHGNFIIKRDSNVERNGGLPSKDENAGKLGIENADFHLKNLRQKSSDNLYGFRDSKCASPFEGKQKIVANVVKNMKNKERPKMLRKFSFSSKTEKELKNKKEKAHPDNAKELTPPSKSTPSAASSIAKMEAVAKSTVHERRSSVTGATICTGTVSVARAVADIALVKSANRAPELCNMQPACDVINKSSNRSPELSDCVQSPSDEVSPPSRPPRRRSGTIVLSSHKKGMAPTPPGHPSNSHNGPQKLTSCDKTSSYTSEHRLSPDIDRNRYQDSPNFFKSSDSLASPFSSDISREDSPVMISQYSPKIHKNMSKSSLTVSDVSKLYPDDNTDSKKVFKSELSIGLQGTTTVHNSPLDSSEQHESEILPAGPPPKKPPRTFAYDIYKSGKESKSAEDVSLKEHDHSNAKLESSSPPNGVPVYAIPLKKKKSDAKLTSKAPVRSNSDLSKKDLVKPSVAPKPPHILNKVKRTSVVDPISYSEKSEDDVMASEFQRQAHIRYSLRRPKKPPPAPPPDSDIVKNSPRSGVNTPSTKTRGQSSTNLNKKNSSSEEDNDYSSSPSKGRRYSHSNGNLQSNSYYPPDDLYQSVDSDSEDRDSPPQSIRLTSHSSYNLHVPTSIEDNQPVSLGHCPVDTLSPSLAGTYRKRSMSDETLYKASRCGEEPIYAMPIYANNKGSRGHDLQRELHYMCSVLFTDEEEADAGRDGHGRIKNGDSTDSGKVKSSIIAAWKREFRQSCRQVQNKIKKTVNR